MPEQTRRDFMKQMAVAGGALALGPLPAIAGEDVGKKAPLDMCIARWGEDTLEADVIKSAATKLNSCIRLPAC